MAKEGLKRPFAVFDIDGTLIRWQLYHAMADALAAKGLINKDDYEAMSNARLAWKRRSSTSFKDYEKRVIKVYEDVLMTLSFKEFDEAVEAVFEEYKDQVYIYTRDLIAKLKSESYLLFAISGSQTEIVAKVADYYGFDAFVGTLYERSATKFNGEKIIGSFNKDVALKKLVAKHHATYSCSIGVGDGHRDAIMLELVEQPIAFNPEATLFEYADKKGWKVVVERKNMIYELERKNGKYQLVKAG